MREFNQELRGWRAIEDVKTELEDAVNIDVIVGAG